MIFYTGINSDPDDTYQAAAALPFISPVANRPIIVDVDTEFGSGAVGGFLLTADQIGRATGLLAMRILHGETASDIPISTVDALKPVFDWRQLQRWHISENRLPAGSEIRFREPTAWDRYCVEILTAIATLLTQTDLISWLLYERGRRRTAEGIARNTMSELTQMNRITTAGELSATIAHEVNQPLPDCRTRRGSSVGTE